MLDTSMRVRAEHFEQPWFKARCAELHEPVRTHRKLWEHVVCTQVYHQHLGQGGRVLGFGVGQEPLPAWFANHGANVLATDQPAAQAGAWAQTGQYAGGLSGLMYPTICAATTFADQVNLTDVEMNAIPDALRQGLYDLVWSSCACEHLGSIEASIHFLCASMACLKPHGVAIHTTELQVWPEDRRLTQGGTVLFTAEDLLELAERLAAQGDRLWTLDLAEGDLPADQHIDEPPFSGTTPHLKLRVYGEVQGQRQDFVTTSIALIATKGQLRE